jgi:transglutaminase-like putative cysteine protease
MMYRIHHSTVYNYDEAVSVAHNLAHLLPRSAPRHVWLTSDLTIAPQPNKRTDRTDFFGNRITFFAIEEPHRSLNVTTTGTVELLPPEPLLLMPQTPWEQVRQTLTADRRHETLHAYQYVFDSPFVKRHADLAAYGAPSFPAGRPLLEGLLDLTARINKEFTYDPEATTVATPVLEVLEKRRGVCQDFAHLQIACLRSLGLAARYVSGYLVTTPPPGRPRLVGADASHAWLSVYFPEVGWIDVDPTNNVMPSDRHITLAWGRDFHDVSPLSGVILGGGHHHVTVQVDVSPM